MLAIAGVLVSNQIAPNAPAVAEAHHQIVCLKTSVTGPTRLVNPDRVRTTGRADCNFAPKPYQVKVTVTLYYGSSSCCQTLIWASGSAQSGTLSGSSKIATLALTAPCDGAHYFRTRATTSVRDHAGDPYRFVHETYSNAVYIDCRFN
jgi:hypothetical protein